MKNKVFKFGIIIVSILATAQMNAQCEWNEDEITKYETCVINFKKIYDATADKGNGIFLGTTYTKQEMNFNLKKYYKKLIDHYKYEDTDIEQRYKDLLNTLK